jgi:hypothetical protein
MTRTVDIAASIREEISRREEEINQLRQVLTILDGGSTKPPPKPRPTPKRRKRVKGKRRPRVELLNLIMETMRSSGEPVSINDVCASLSGESSRDPVRRGVNTLRTDGRIRLVMGAHGNKPALYAPMPEEQSVA